MPAPSKLKTPNVRKLAIPPGDIESLHLSNASFIWESSTAREMDSGMSFAKTARFKYIGLPQCKSVKIHHGKVTVSQNGKVLSQDILHEEPLTFVENLFNSSFEKQNSAEFPFIGGLVGFLSYDAVKHFENLPGLETHPEEAEFYFILASQFIVIDREKKEAHLVDWEDEECASLNLLTIDNTKVSNNSSRELVENKSQAQYESIVEKAKQYIIDGDIFQVVLGQERELHSPIDPYETYFQLKKTNPSPYHFLIKFDDKHLVGASPEMMLYGQNTNGGYKVSMRPVAGTYPRGASIEEDEKLKTELRENPKERAEHIMLVDLERNDIGRVSRTGSVEVKDLFNIESYSAVHHLVSQVNGTLNEGETPLSALKSCFPIGTLAGTPKIRAMEIISELEKRPRGTFGGAALMLGADLTLDSTVIIRSLVVGSEKSLIRTGAGIVYDSDPTREYKECQWKAEAITKLLSGDR